MPGNKIQISLPYGVFTLKPEEPQPYIFLAGGIGITPFRTFIKYNIDKNLTTPMHLIYSNSIPEEIVFRLELEEWAKTYPFFKLDLTVTKAEESNESWTGLKGRIDENIVKKLVPDYKLPTFWICGPPAMVDALEKVLGKLELTSGKIRSEKFTGY